MWSRGALLAQRVDEEIVSGGDGDVLSAIDRIRHRPRRDLPADSVPEWVRQVERDMKVAPMDWDLLARDGGSWMAYWDQHVRGTGKKGSREQ